MPLVHHALRRIARRCLYGQRTNLNVQATELVNEAFLRPVDVQQIDSQNRMHFLAMSARLMRRLLIDLARLRGADKRGGGAVRVTLDDAVIGGVAPHADVIRLDDVLQGLAGCGRPRRRAAILRRLDRRDRGRARRLVENRPARLGIRPGVAAAGLDPRGRR